MGQSYEIYNLVSMPDLQVNARFIPYYKTAFQVEPTGTMIGEVGIKIGSTRLFINPNSTEADMNKTPVSMAKSWSVDLSQNARISNEVDGRMYKFTIETDDLSLTFIRKLYAISGLEPQFHFDYKAKLHSENIDIHG